MNSPIYIDFFNLVLTSISNRTFAKLTLAKTIGKPELQNIYVRTITIENELIFKVKTFKGEEVNVFLNDFIGKSDVEGEVYPWFYIHLD